MGTRYPSYKFTTPNLPEAERLAVGKTLSEYGEPFCVEHFKCGLLCDGNATLVPTTRELRRGQANKVLYGYVGAMATSLVIVIGMVLMLSRLPIWAVLLLGALVFSLASFGIAVTRYRRWVAGTIKKYQEHVEQHGDFRYVPTPSSSSIVERARRENPEYARQDVIQVNDAGSSHYG